MVEYKLSESMMVDGYHRMYKAYHNGLKEYPAYIFSFVQQVRFLLNENTFDWVVATAKLNQINNQNEDKKLEIDE